MLKCKPALCQKLHKRVPWILEVHPKKIRVERWKGKRYKLIKRASFCIWFWVTHARNQNQFTETSRMTSCPCGDQVPITICLKVCYFYSKHSVWFDFQDINHTCTISMWQAILPWLAADSIPIITPWQINVNTTLTEHWTQLRCGTLNPVTQCTLSKASMRRLMDLDRAFPIMLWLQ